ncbi:MAG: c-type cytochrome [Maribacter sp.]|nr:c-type cytochrome [Maribacter sp.]
MKSLPQINKLFFGFVLFGVIITSIIGCYKGPSPPLSPKNALDAFVLADSDLKIELVAAEPLVQDPVAITFDAAGNLWVVEMLGFMEDIEGTAQEDRVGRVSVLFDDDKDGQMDRSQVFLDSLVLPRAITLVKGGVLIAENIPLWFVQDLDGDFKADTKILIDSTYGGSGMPEHSANGLWHGMDNWLYNAKSKYRYRFSEGHWEKGETEFRGQWGIAHDNAGRLFYNYNWSQLHADLVPPNALQNNKNHQPSSGIDHGLTLERAIFPIRSNTAVNRGYVPGTLDNAGRLLEFASACGPLVYRGDALPSSYLGDAFVCEPTANLIKQDTILEEGFMLSAKGVYKDKEFLASTDERFRPVSLASGPDGALYVVDMYKGIIQDGAYMTPYLREVTLARKLDKPIHMGRIWRITSKEGKADTPHFSTADAKTLVSYLGSKNGWTRDMAQRLIIEKGDLAVVPELQKMIVHGSALGQLHAIWTLEGLGHKDTKTYLDALHAKDPKVVQAALRLTSAMLDDRPELAKELQDFISEHFDTADPLVQMQMVLVSDHLDEKIAFDIASKFLATYGQLPVARDVVMSSMENRESALLDKLLGEWKNYDQNREIFVEMLATAIANNGEANEVRGLMNLLEMKNSEDRLWVRSAVINGIINSKGSNETGKIALGQQPAFLKNKDIPEALRQKLTWPGKPREQVLGSGKVIDVDSKTYATGRQKFLNLCANCHGTEGEGMPRFAPPLKNSEWVTGADYKLAMILLHGLEGAVTVNGKVYDIPDILPNMPSFSTLQNEDIAAIATYIRNTWGHSASPVSSGRVGGIRFRTQGQITPWKATELDTLVFDKDL